MNIYINDLNRVRVSISGQSSISKIVFFILSKNLPLKFANKLMLSLFMVTQAGWMDGLLETCMSFFNNVQSY